MTDTTNPTSRIPEVCEECGRYLVRFRNVDAGMFVCDECVEYVPAHKEGEVLTLSAWEETADAVAFFGADQYEAEDLERILGVAA